MCHITATVAQVTKQEVNQGEVEVLGESVVLLEGRNDLQRDVGRLD